MWKTEELETVACDFCGSQDHAVVITRADGLAVVECRSCHVCFLNPRPQASLITRLYQADYFEKNVSPHGAGTVGYVDYLSAGYQREMVKASKARLAVAKAFFDVSGKKCLEIGCATGEFCQVLHKHGARVKGIDLSSHAVQTAQSRYPSLVSAAGPIESLPVEETFEAIFAFEVIEHVASPKTFLMEAIRHLKTGGWLILTTPNYACGKRIGNHLWSGFLTSFEHLYFFTPESLAGYGSVAGLKAMDWFTDRGSGLFVPPAPYREPGGLRGLAKSTLRRLGLLDAAFDLRDSLRPSETSYMRHGEGHNLYMVFTKT